MILFCRDTFDSRKSLFTYELLLLLVFQEFFVLIGKLIEDFFDFMDVIAKDCCISDRQFTALHPHLTAMIIIKLFNINALILRVIILCTFFDWKLLLSFLTVIYLALTSFARHLTIIDIRCQSGNGLNTISHHWIILTWLLLRLSHLLLLHL